MTSWSSIVKRFDLFGKRLPTFNIKGVSEIRTQTGAYLSLILGLLGIAYSILKLSTLLNRKNPQTIANDFPTETDENYRIANSDEFMIAFALENWQTGAKDDLRYI